MAFGRFKATAHPQQVGNPSQTDFLRPINAIVAESDDRALPPSEFDILNRRFQFTLDAAASVANAKLPRFHTRETNGLAADWSGERVYCNPPFSDIRPWIEKAWAETSAGLIVLLLPANRTEQSWWQTLIEPRRDQVDSPLRVEFLPNRIRFIRKDRVTVGPNERPPFGCCLCIWTHFTT